MTATDGVLDGPARGRAQWCQIESQLSEHWYKADIEAVKVQVACMAAHFITDFPPAWCMAIAPPGSCKTVILEAMDGLDGFYLIDQITPSTFISGKIDDNEMHTKAGRAKWLKKQKQNPANIKTFANPQAQEREAKKGKRHDSASLLHRIGNSGIIALPDFSTILSMHETSRDNIFAQMRRIYDGTLRREFGTSEDLTDRE